jgi:hypothetical protein
MGKMPQKSFPLSNSHPNAPFEKVHSDLKEFPTESYHRNKYFVSFIDDYSSFGWIQCLCAKSSALTALHDFLVMVKNQYGTTPKEWMSDAGGEYKSKEFLRILNSSGIKILQSVPHTPQQNGRAERFNHTIMEKAEAMRHEACLPDSYWEFVVEHAVHCYNCTPVMRLKWCTPYEAITKTKPDISRLRVFGCGAYVYLHKDVRKNKLAPKSELMIHLGEAEGQKGWRFMRPTNRLFFAPNALFDELLFPKCKDKCRTTTCVDETRDKQPPKPAESPAYPPITLWDDNEDPPKPLAPPIPNIPPPTLPPQGRPCTPVQRRPPSPRARPGLPLLPTYRMRPGVDLETPPRPQPQRCRFPTPASSLPPLLLTCQESPPPRLQRSLHRPRVLHARSPSQSRSPTPAPRRSEWIAKGKAPAWPGNIYGEHRHPMEIEKDTRSMTRWTKLVKSEPGSPNPGPSHFPRGFEEPVGSPPPSAQFPIEEGNSDLASDEEDLQESNGDDPATASDHQDSHEEQAKVEGLLLVNNLHSLSKEGGVAYLNHLLAMAVPPIDSDTPDTTKVREWSFRDIQCMPTAQKQAWIDACKQELDSLCAWHVYDLVDPPKGRRIIRNRWVFDVKTDGRKRA